MSSLRVLAPLLLGGALAGPLQAGDLGISDEVNLLTFRVLDAEYSSSLDRIVAVSSSPSNALYIHDPVLDASIGVALPLAPTCVSVSPDGHLAAVGHDGWVSTVDLVNATLLDTLATSTDPGDVVLGGNGWIYLFPSSGQWVNMHCVEIATGNEQLGQGTIRQGTLARLHPGGEWVYGADNGLSPSDIEKYDISGGPSVVLYDSPYHGDYAMSGDLWITEDGLRIIARSGNVFRTSSSQADDITYNGSLSETSLVEFASHSVETGKIVVIPEKPFFGSGTDSELHIYDDAFLAHEETVALPMADVGGNAFESHGRYVFLDDDGAVAWILVEVDASSGLLFNHGVTRYAFEPVLDSFVGDVASLSLGSGGTQALTLDAGAEHAGLPYQVLGSLNGTSPGIALGGLVIPLNFDLRYFLLTATAPTQTPIVNPIGVLDGEGRAAAGFALPAGAPAALLDLTLDHAFIVLGDQGVVFASNPVEVSFTP